VLTDVNQNSPSQPDKGFKRLRKGAAPQPPQPPAAHDEPAAEVEGRSPASTSEHPTTSPTATAANGADAAEPRAALSEAASPPKSPGSPTTKQTDSPEPSEKKARPDSPGPTANGRAASPKAQQKKAMRKGRKSAAVVESDDEGSVASLGAEEEDDEASESDDASGDEQNNGSKNLEAGGSGGATSAAKKKKTSKSKKKLSKAKSGSANVGDKSVEIAQRLSKHDPLAAATWAAGAPVPYMFLAETFESISETSARLEITEKLCNSLRAVLATSPQDLLAVVYLSINQIAPSHEGLELGIGDATLIKALAEATGRKESVVKKDYDEQGDLGTVAQVSRSMQKTMFQPAPLTVQKVIAAFREIAATNGAKSGEKKRALIKKLLVSSREMEAGYIVRSLQGKLRIGLAQQSVITALAHAVCLQEEKKNGAGEGELADRLDKAVNLVKQVYSECPSYDQLVPAMLEHGLAELATHCHFVPGVPIMPMLAKPTTGVAEVLTRFTDVQFSCEYKYDGERAQVHLLEDGSVKIFSRNSEENTERWPDLVALMKEVVKPGVSSLVLDCEAVAFDREENKILPFQVLSTRGRKTVAMEDVKVQVCLYAFDCIYLNGEVLLQKDLTERRQKLYSSLEEIPGRMKFAEERTSRDVDALQGFLDDSIKEGTEGLIVKALDTTYEPSKRSLNWLKLKKDYMDGMGDSLDLVVIGAYLGKGKRTGVYGAFLLACYDEENEEYQSICKIGTGFSEEELVKHSQTLNEVVVSEPPSYYSFGENPNVTPDVWFTPKQVWEIKAADLSISPVHRAALGRVDENKGIALRFPRFLHVREDKTPEMATSAAQVADMYNSQAMMNQ